MFRVAISTCVAAIACLMFISTSSASAAIRAGASPTTVLADGTQRTTYSIGPLNVTSGQNKIGYKAIEGSGKPAVDGWITSIQPNLTYADGTIPSSSKVMFHHGVWINQTRSNQQFFATGEEKTNMVMPPGYGYRYKASDIWYLNHMIHNLVPETMTLYATYTIDFIPATDPAAAGMKEAKPIWMDVEKGSGYPVFDTYRDSGGPDGEIVYPQDFPNAYSPGVHKNEYTVPQDMVLLGTTGHVHTGGLSTNLYLRRNGAAYGGPTCEQPPNYDAQLAKFKAKLKKLTLRQKKLNRSMAPKKAKKLRKSLRTTKYKKWMKAKVRLKAKLKKLKKSTSKAQAELKAKDDSAKATYAACVDTQPEVQGNRVHLFESTAHYFEPAGPVSWDVAMMSTKPDWRVQVRAGDILELQTTYETKLASWYENMGINIIYYSDETNGRDPYVTKVDTEGVLNHGHYAENDDHGGTDPVVGPDPSTLPNGLASGGPFSIGSYSYGAGNFKLPGESGRPPVVQQGQTFTFKLSTSDANNQIWHSLTSCKSPCNKSTGIAYPIADGDFQFDSGQLGNLNGNGGAPTVGRESWTTPADLPVGTHTFYCRIHPLMRGAVRVVKPGGST